MSAGSSGGSSGRDESSGSKGKSGSKDKGPMGRGRGVTNAEDVDEPIVFRYGDSGRAKS
jgi:hypothetical protein